MGPLVAGLSLGSPAFMHFRLQRKHDRMGERKGILMSFILRHVRRLSPSIVLVFLLHPFFTDVFPFEPPGHIQGDVFVMDGIGVQKFYEWVHPTKCRNARSHMGCLPHASLFRHTVVPTNFRIAATARSINTPKKMQGPAKVEPVLTPLPQSPLPALLTMPELPSQMDL